MSNSSVWGFVGALSPLMGFGLGPPEFPVCSVLSLWRSRLAAAGLPGEEWYAAGAGKPDVDWSDPAAKDRVVGTLFAVMAGGRAPRLPHTEAAVGRTCWPATL
ncbi:MAG: hypothetical protein LBE08_11195 [Bifidobacteriaceae bacterium]|nr:hypothetical protein [Bifidobacteriaceae bacterium]